MATRKRTLDANAEDPRPSKYYCVSAQQQHREELPDTTRPIQTISYSALVRRERHTIRALEHACRGDGCFYLDLQGPESSAVPGKVESVRELSQWLHDLPEEIKTAFLQDGRCGGLNDAEYGALLIKDIAKDDADTTTVLRFKQRNADSSENTDGYLFRNWQISQASILTPETLTNPLRTMFSAEKYLFSSTVALLGTISQTILDALSSPNSPTLGDYLNLTHWHRPTYSSATSLDFWKYSWSSATNATTNAGINIYSGSNTLSILFSPSSDMQLLRRGTDHYFTRPDNFVVHGRHPDRWVPIRPLPNHAVVFTGEALSHLTAGALNAAATCHLTPSTGLHGVEPHYSVAYCLSPEEGARLDTVDGHSWICDRGKFVPDYSCGYCKRYGWPCRGGQMDLKEGLADACDGTGGPSSAMARLTL